MKTIKQKAKNVYDYLTACKYTLGLEALGCIEHAFKEMDQEPNLIDCISTHASLGYEITFKTAMGGFFVIKIKKRAFDSKDDKYFFQTLGKENPSDEKIIKYISLMTSKMSEPDFESMDSDFMEY